MAAMMIVRVVAGFTADLRERVPGSYPSGYHRGVSAGSVSVVVPTYREAENLRPLVERVDAALGQQPYDYELRIVDDDSGDGTEALAAELAEQFPVALDLRRDERGLASAVMHGFGRARGDVLVCMDADLSHPPEALPALIEPLLGDRADFVIGSRYIDGGRVDDDWGPFRRMNSKVATLLARPLTGVRDPLAGFFGLTRPVFDAAEGVNAVGYKIGLELLVRARPRRCLEVPIHFDDRVHGESKLTVRTQIEYLGQLATLMQYRMRRWKRGESSPHA